MRSLQHGHASAHALSTLHRDDSGDVRVAEDDGTDGALPDIAPVEVPLKDQFVAGVRKALPGLLPPLHWVPRYAQLGADPAQRHPPASLVRGVWNTLRGDLQGGITAGVLMIPQGIAYAMLAGVPVTLGLYSGFIGTILYAIFGTSRQLNFGPLAMVSLMIRGVLEEHNLMTPEQKAPAAIAMGFIVGIVYLLLGLCRFGFVVNFLSQPVLSGFTSAAAVIIFVSQLPAFFGVHIESSSYAWMVFYRVCAQLGNTHKWTLLVGVLCALQILVMKKLVPSIPGSLLSIVLAIAVSWPVHLAEYGVAVVGTIPAGLHGFAFPWTDEVPMLSLIVDSVPVALVDFMESISVAKTWAAKFEYETDANQELVALGVANTLHSFFGGYPSMGAIGRSAVSGGSGARTSLHNLFTGLTVMVALLVLTPVIYHLPQATLAAVLMTAVFSLIDYEIARVLWRVSKLDLLTLAVCFGLTIIGGVTIGIFVAIVLSLLLTLYRASNPHTCLLGRTPGTVIYRDASRFRKAAVIPNIIIFRFDGHVFFGNTGVLREQLTAAERQLVERGEKLQAVVLDATAITTIDYQGVLAFRELAINYAKRRVLFCVANLDNRALLTFEAAGLLSLIGRDHFFWRVHDAVLAIQSGTLAVTPFVPPPPPPTFLEWARTVRCTREFWIRQLPDFMVTSRGRLRRPCRSDVESDEVSLIGADRQRTDV